MREAIEKIAREALEGMMSDPNTIWPESLGGTIHYDSRKIAKHFESALIALLRSDEVGYKEALEDLSNESCLCEIDNCIHARAEQKLKELESL